MLSFLSIPSYTSYGMNAYSLKDLTLYFMKLGSLGWGGPVALVSSMRRDLVDIRNWISEEDFKEGLALAQLAPGPLAAQLAIYLECVLFKVRGATIVGFPFVLPSFFKIVALGASPPPACWQASVRRA